jgi:hypothetical protein
MSKEDIDREDLDEDLDEDEADYAPGQQRGWWSQNWRWFLPTLLLVIVLLGGGGIYWSLFTRVFHLDVCQSGMQAIQASSEVTRALGQPITLVRWGFPPSARLEAGERDVRWDIEGPQGRAKAHVHARQLQGQWAIDLLEVTLANGQRLALAAGDDNVGEAPPFAAPKPEAKKPESKGAAPEINLPIPPDGGK